MFKVLLILIIKVAFTATSDQQGNETTVINDRNQHVVTIRSFDKGIKAKNFHSVLVDDDNTKWFLTEDGIVSFDGNNWHIHNKNRKLPTKDLKDFAYGLSSYGREIWIATPEGVTVAALPIDKSTGVTNYHTENTTILSNNVLAVAISRSSVRWIGTDKGISAFNNDKWLTNSYQRKYRETMFKQFPITSMATTPNGDSLYVGTDGAGVARIYRNDVDAVSGASEYAQWGPINLPSDNIYSICVTPDGTQWFGTDMGVARHTGTQTLDNWTIFTTDNGLVNNFVQAIAIDKKGNMWFGTKNGISFFDGSEWKSFITDDGMISNNILCIAIDKDNIIWFGTDNGVLSCNNEEFTNYK